MVAMMQYVRAFKNFLHTSKKFITAVGIEFERHDTRSKNGANLVIVLQAHFYYKPSLCQE